MSLRAMASGNTDALNEGLYDDWMARYEVDIDESDSLGCDLWVEVILPT